MISLLGPFLDEKPLKFSNQQICKDKPTKHNHIYHASKQSVVLTFNMKLLCHSARYFIAIKCIRLCEEMNCTWDGLDTVKYI